ncbi:MAG: cyclic nucleotide-binding domain-containing protein [Myxococcota bacterium]|nr:cyclic nucleotide-binding domain-containing protein [Myxococcota bacterium]
MKLSADRLRILRERVLLFDDFRDEEILDLLQFAKKKGFTNGDILVHENDKTTSIFIIISGRAEVVRDHHDGPEVLALLEPGSTVGEMAMVDGAPRSARVVARGDGVVLIVEADLVKNVDHPILQKFYKNLSSILVRRLRAANKKLEAVAARGLTGASLGKLKQADLSGVDLNGLRAKRINLAGADLRAADLRDADLRGADLRGARLDGANLKGASVSRARPPETEAPNGPDDTEFNESTEHYWERLMKSLAQRARTNDDTDN